MSTTPSPVWGVYRKGYVMSIHLTVDDANAAAEQLRTTVRRESDITIRPRPALAAWWRTEATA